MAKAAPRPAAAARKTISKKTSRPAGKLAKRKR
jgi:hypothetical protein